MKEIRYFQWIDGEYDGSVVTLEDIVMEDGDTFFIFSDGERCNAEYISPMTDDAQELKGKALVEISSATNVWTRKTPEKRTHVDTNTGEITECVPYEMITGHGLRMSLVPPSGAQDVGKPLPKIPTENEKIIKEIADYSDCKKSVEMTPEIAVEAKKETARTNERTSESDSDPVRILVKNCKKHSTSIPLTLTVDLPSKSIFKIANSEFEDGAKTFVDCIVEDIQPEMIYAALREALLFSYSAEKTAINSEKA